MYTKKPIFGTISREPDSSSFFVSGIPYTMSRSGRAALFTRDPDANALEFVQVDS